MNHAHITIIGHLGKDPVYDEKNETARFSVAHTHKRKAGDQTTWYSVTAWRQSAKIAAQYLKKGDAVGIVGRPFIDKWTNDQGVEKETLKIDANDVILMGRPVASTAETDRLPAVQVAAPARVDLSTLNVRPSVVRRPANAADDDAPF